MRICLVSPAPAHSHNGNRITAVRYARILRGLGHQVLIEQEYTGRPCDLMVAMHARRSFSSIERFRREYADRRVVLVLTGTDLYGDIRQDASAQQALEMASRLVVLQPKGKEELPEHLRPKVHAIYQSAERPAGRPPRRKDVFEVCVIGHLRPVKDPFRAAEAVRLLPAESRIRVVHLGAALSEEMEEGAERESVTNPRYRRLGDLPHWKALRILARSRVMVLSSQLEGGANVISEAIVSSVPVLASRISSSIGILGADYPGFFPVGNTEALKRLLDRAENDPSFLEGLRAWCRRLQPLVAPARERRSWKRLLRELISP